MECRVSYTAHGVNGVDIGWFNLPESFSELDIGYSEVGIISCTELTFWAIES